MGLVSEPLGFHHFLPDDLPYAHNDLGISWLRWRFGAATEYAIVVLYQLRMAGEGRGVVLAAQS